MRDRYWRKRSMQTLAPHSWEQKSPPPPLPTQPTAVTDHLVPEKYLVPLPGNLLSSEARQNIVFNVRHGVFRWYYDNLLRLLARYAAFETICLLTLVEPKDDFWVPGACWGPIWIKEIKAKSWNARHALDLWTQRLVILFDMDKTVPAWKEPNCYIITYLKFLLETPDKWLWRSVSGFSALNLQLPNMLLATIKIAWRAQGICLISDVWVLVSPTSFLA